MNAHALTVLEFERVLDRVASRAESEMGRAALRARRPGTDLPELRTELARVAETLLHLEMHTGWGPAAVPDVREGLRTLRVEGGILAAPELLRILRLLEATRELAEALPAQESGHESGQEYGKGVGTPDARDGDGIGPPSFPHLAHLRTLLPVRPELESALSGIVDEDGTVRDGASPRLAEVRRELRSARGRIVRRLEEFLGTLPDRVRVEGASVSIRDGRYVIPVRREGRSEVGGIIHGESGTGATLFVEPPVAIRLMNELRDLERDEVEEVRRILGRISAQLRPLRGELSAGFAALVDFDTLRARARTARDWDATPPEFLDAEEPGLRIVGGRHPLLLEQEIEVVPFFLELDEEERVVVVSGPNTGGKTVFLKAMGLIHLLAQSGIVPPVQAGTRLPVLEDVFADIGDEQSIAESLSTFSAHLANTREILEGAGPGTLVLLDELGTGTDPSEGAALARAVLEILMERGARVLVTSHLAALKRLDGEGTGILNASLLFDPLRVAPTYHLQKGRPGRSYGLAIARGLGFPEAVLDRAEGYVDPGELKVEALLRTLEGRERELSQALREADLAREEAQRLREEARARAAELEERERTAERRAAESARNLLLEARGEVEAAIREARSEGSTAVEAGTRARQRVEAAARRQLDRAARAAPRSRGKRGRSLEPALILAEGERVRIRGSGTRGVVRELREGRVTVEAGGIRIQVSTADVEPVGSLEEPTPRAGRVSLNVPEVDARPEVDLRGLRVEEVELELGRSLDDAVVAGLGELRVIHGKGTGAVKARVRELLPSDPRVADFRPGGEGEGGAGVTVVVLR